MTEPDARKISTCLAELLEPGSKLLFLFPVRPGKVKANGKIRFAGLELQIASIVWRDSDEAVTAGTRNVDCHRRRSDDPAGIFCRHHHRPSPRGRGTEADPKRRSALRGGFDRTRIFERVRKILSPETGHNDAFPRRRCHLRIDGNFVRIKWILILSLKPD